MRPGTEVFFHNMKGPWPHWLDQDIRILRLHFLPNYVFGKVAMFNRVPVGSISLRDCTAKGEGFIIMWRPSTCALPSKNRSQNERPAPRERSLDETRSIYVSSVPLSQLWLKILIPVNGSLLCSGQRESPLLDLFRYLHEEYQYSTSTSTASTWS